MNIILPLAIAAGGAMGALGRHTVTSLTHKILGDTAFPWGVFLANVIGACLLGIIIEGLALRGEASQELRAFLVVGMLGGFTTFSSFTLDVVLLFQRGEALLATGYIAASVLLSCTALLAGMWLIKSML